MATVTPTRSNDVGTGDGSVVQYTWTLTSSNRDGLPVEMVEWADRTLTATGTWGGATLTLQGSNDNTTFLTQSNAAGGSAATLTADGMITPIEAPRYFRPNLTVAGVGASLTVILTLRRANPLRT